MGVRKFLSVLTVAVWIVGALGAPLEAGDDLTELSLEDLMDIEVTSADRKERRLSRTAAAVYVITGEDIRRSGATNLPDALRLAAGLQVGSIDANKWAVSARGFSGRFANKMLVLVDGRSVYTPLYAGVFWNQQDTLLADVERIEVIRGPGATMWGANAVNGVINIITRTAGETGGGLVELHAGSEEKGSAAFRYGGTFGRSAHYRVWAKFFDRDSFARPGGGDAADGWDASRAGFRIDWDRGQADSLMVQGGVYDGEAGQTATNPILTPPYTNTVDDTILFSGNHVLARWRHALPGGSVTTLQGFYDRTDRFEARLGEVRETFDLDFHHRVPVASRHEIVWGLGFRLTSDEIDDGFEVSLEDPDRSVQLFSAFVQDDITLQDGRFRLTVGSKFEHNDYTGLEVQPNVRAFWKLDDRQGLWAAVSRAIRSPSRVYSDARFNLLVFPDPDSGLPLLVSGFGDDRVESENLLAYEVGYRIQATDRLSLDATGFFHRYTDLLDLEDAVPFMETDPMPPHLVVPLIAGNPGEAESYGLELTSTWNVNDRWRLHAWYTNLQVDRPQPETGSSDLLSVVVEGGNPEHQAHLRSYLDLPGGFALDVILHYFGRLEDQAIPAYTRADVRFAWSPSPALEISAVVQNLLEDTHLEEVDFLSATSEVERGAYVKLSWRFGGASGK